MTLQEIKDAEKALLKVITAPLKAKVAYRISKIAKKFLSEVKDIEAQRIKLVDKYGEKTKTGTTVPADKMKVFSDELAELLKEEVNLDIQQIPFDLLEAVPLTAMDFVLLEKIIQAPENQKDAVDMAKDDREKAIAKAEKDR